MNRTSKGGEDSSTTRLAPNEQQISITGAQEQKNQQGKHAPAQFIGAAHGPQVAEDVTRLRQRDREALRVRKVEHVVEEHRERGGELWCIVLVLDFILRVLCFILRILGAEFRGRGRGAPEGRGVRVRGRRARVC